MSTELQQILKRIEQIDKDKATEIKRLNSIIDDRVQEIEQITTQLNKEHGIIFRARRELKALQILSTKDSLKKMNADDLREVLKTIADIVGKMQKDNKSV